MNKIDIVNDKIKSKEINKSINVFDYEKKDLFDINKITININENENLILNIDNKLLTKLKIDITVEENCNVNLYIYSKGEKAKIKYNYIIKENSNLNVFKYNDILSINEMVEVNLNGYNAKIDYIFKSIGKNKESYDYTVFHNNKNTHSNIINNCVNLEGITNIQISSSVKKDIIECVCNQYNRIINLTNNRCEIRPILYIDTDNVDANHSALIGNFEKEELFYLETMGIKKADAYKLLIEGFLISGITNEFLKKKIMDSIKKYWR